MATILIVDDDTALREGLAETVSDLGHRPIVAASGREGLARLARAGDVMEEGLGSSDLAPETRAVLARNLVVIDSAIAECQRALDADPGSPVLAGLLRAAHRQRVEFLQQAARLPRS